MSSGVASTSGPILPSLQRTANIRVSASNAGIAFRDLKRDVPYFPTVGMKKPGETLRANFGQEPFAFDIDKMVADEKAAIEAEIACTSVANETNMIHDLIGQYLAHDGYVETARAFREEIIEEARALANDGSGEIAYGEQAEDLDALNRQSMSSSPSLYA
jgi:hypothetical protein